MALLQVLYSPRAAFERLREKGGWIGALIAVCLLSAVTVYFQWPMVEREMASALEMSGEPIDESTTAVINNVAKITTWASGLLSPVITMFFVGLLLYLLNLIVRGEAGYMQLSKTALYSLVPGILGGLLQAGLAVSLDAKKLTDVTLTGGALFAEKSGALFVFASTLIDPFGWWSLALLTIGAAVMMRKPVRTILYWTVGAWLLVRLGSAITAMNSLGAGFGA